MVLDEVGQQPRTGWETVQFYTLINELWNKDRQLILTTDLTPAALVQRLTLATLSRILGMCATVVVRDRDPTRRWEGPARTGKNLKGSAHEENPLQGKRRRGTGPARPALTTKDPGALRAFSQGASHGHESS